MAALLPRGVQSPRPPEDWPLAELASPSEDLNLTLRELLDKNTVLEAKVEELEGDKRHFQSKLEEYIRYDREEGSESRGDKPTVSQLEKRVSELLSEREELKVLLVKRDGEIGEFYSSQQPQFLERGHRAHLLQRLNELQASSALTEERLTQQIQTLKSENSRLREELGRLTRAPPGPGHNPPQHWVGQEQGQGQGERQPSWDAYHQSPRSNTEGYSSLPESLPSHTAITTSQGRAAEMLAALRLTSREAPPHHPTATPSQDTMTAELKKVKKQLDKYKTANIELDQKLKDAKLELQKHSEGRGDVDVGYRMDMERLRSDNNRLRVQLDRAMGESNHFRSLVGRRY